MRKIPKVFRAFSLCVTALLLLSGCKAGKEEAAWNKPIGPGKVRWSFTAPKSLLEQPIVDDDGTIYVGNYDPKSSQQKTFAFDRFGSKKWEANGQQPIPIGDKRVAVISMGGTHILSSSGKELWRTPGILLGHSEKDGTVYCELTPNSPSHLDGRAYSLVALSRDGKKRWEFKNPHSYSMPESLNIGRDGTLYIAFTPVALFQEHPTAFPSSETDPAFYGGSVVALHPDGNKKWEFEIKNSVLRNVKVDGNTVYAGSDYKDGALVALNESGKEKWRFKALTTNVALGKDGTVYAECFGISALNRQGKKQWSRLGPHVSQAAIGPDGSVYVSTDESPNAIGVGTPQSDAPQLALRALDKNGKEKWSYTYSGGYPSTSLQFGSDGTTYFAAIDHGGITRTVYALSAKGKKLWTFKAPCDINEPGITLDGNTLYVTAKNKLYAVSTK